MPRGAVRGRLPGLCGQGAVWCAWGDWCRIDVIYAVWSPYGCSIGGDPI
jgi:hypothetical protein